MTRKNITTIQPKKLQEELEAGSITVSVIGIGRIGLPTALSFANSGLPTIGVDINLELVNMINSGHYPLKDEPEFDKVFEKVIKEKKFHAVNDITQAVSESDVIILSLPTPMNNENIPDYSALLSVGKDLNKLVSDGQLIIVESTVEPGFIENELLAKIEAGVKNLKSGIDFHLAVCPETANPGEIMRDFKKLPRLVGAIDEKISEIVSTIYSHVFNVELIHMPNCKTANAVKLTTNVFRDVNIAFINELALLFEKLGIDTMTVIDAAKRKYNFQPHYPSAGVGGPCLPVNSYQFLNSSKKFNTELLKIVQAAREINEYMPKHVFQLLTEAFSQIKKPIKDSTITVLGLSYKPNVHDTQIAPSQEVIKILDENVKHVKIYDPYFRSVEIFSHKTENSIENALQDSDAVIIVTGHQEFHEIQPSFYSKKLKTPIIIDCTGIINSQSAKDAGLIFRGIGRGEK